MKAMEQFNNMPESLSPVPEGAVVTEVEFDFKERKRSFIDAANAQISSNEKKLTEKSDLMRYFFRILTKQSGKEKIASLERHCIGMAEYVQLVLRLTPAEYDSKFNTEFNKEVSLSTMIRRIVNETPDKVKRECFYYNKSIIFKQVFPEYYKNGYKENTLIDVFYAKKDFKAGLTASAKDPESREGMTKILHDALSCNVKIFLNEKDHEPTIQEMMEMIASPNFMKIKDGKKPSIVDIVDAMGEYANMLDFFFLNLPYKEQIENADAFMEIRKRAGYPEKGVLYAIYDTFKTFEPEYHKMIE